MSVEAESPGGTRVFSDLHAGPNRIEPANLLKFLSPISYVTDLGTAVLLEN
jgi:hypothetical protein